MMNSAAVERRSVRRFAVSYSGELASGSSLIQVIVSDVSYSGCGLELVGTSGEVPAKIGVLSINGAKENRGAILLPVTIANHRIEGGKSRVGLKFGKLSKPQTRDLLGVLERALEF